MMQLPVIIFKNLCTASVLTGSNKQAPCKTFSVYNTVLEEPMHSTDRYNDQSLKSATKNALQNSDLTFLIAFTLCGFTLHVDKGNPGVRLSCTSWFTHYRGAYPRSVVNGVS